MPRLRKPPTAQEVKQWFEDAPLNEAVLMHELIEADLKKRLPNATKAPRKRTTKTPTNVAVAAGFGDGA